jgi:hypothetical protein
MIVKKIKNFMLISDLKKLFQKNAMKTVRPRKPFFLGTRGGFHEKNSFSGLSFFGTFYKIPSDLKSA